MSRGKPNIISRKPTDRKRTEAKAEAEAAFRSGDPPSTPPVELRGMPHAQRAWRKLMKAHSQLPGQLYNRLDQDFIILFCQSVQSRQRAVVMEIAAHKMFVEGHFELDDLLKVRTELRMSTRLCADLLKQLFCTPRSRGGVSPVREESAAEVVERELLDLNKLLGGSG
jgi:hypothetical protein